MKTIKKHTRKLPCEQCGANCGSSHKKGCTWRKKPRPTLKAQKQAILKAIKRNNKIQYDKLMEELNLIDEQAEQCSGNYNEQDARATAYKKLADFISKTFKQ